jgi:tRNA A-37 threonylcarbamoyl transferase component Bud32
MSEEPATFRDGRYRVARVLGEGAQATTFDATDTTTGRAVAIKRFRVRGAKSWKEVELAEREAKVLAHLTHAGLPRYIEHFEEQGELFLVTEKIPGQSLAALRTRGVTFGERDVLRFLNDAAATLGYLHGRAPPIVHRDIKPSNVVRRPDGSYVLIDFGAVRDRMKPEGGSTVVGTFGYMAPEQFQGRAMPTSDVYAVGATALTLLTGREPEDLPHKGLGIDVSAALAQSRVSPDLVRALGAMLVPDPDQRAPTIEAALDGVRGPATIPPYDSAGQKQRRELRRLARDARQEERRRRRAARRPLGPLPGLILIIVLLALTVAQIAVGLALRVVVPTVLTILSLFFGAGLRRAAESTREAGRVAHAAIRRAQKSLDRSAPEPGVRVAEPEPAPEPVPQARIAQDDDGDEDADEEAEEEARDDAKARRRR